MASIERLTAIWPNQNDMSKKTGSSTGYLARSKPAKMRPEFTLSEKDLPAIKDWEVGKRYSIEVNVEMVNHSKGDMWDSDGKEHSARFRIMSVDSEAGVNKSENTK